MKKILFELMAAGIVVGAACTNPTGNGNGCGGNGSGVLIIAAHDNLTFNPQMATASQSQAICMQNDGSKLHNIVADSEVPGDSLWRRNYGSSLPPNLPYQFSVPVGDYYYHCSIHGGNQTGMWGKISVR